MTEPDALSVRDLCVSVTPGGPLILDHVDLTLPAGTLTLLRGRSGSGKTTLLNAILGWVSPRSGSIEVGGGAARGGGAAWADLAVAPQTAALFPELTVRDNIDLGGHVAPTAVSWPMPELLDLLDLTRIAERPADQISVGEQQRCSLARALAVVPRVLLVDEPLASQDVTHALGVVSALRAACAAGATCLVASHDPAVLDAADQVVVLDDGKLTAGAPP